MNDELKFFMYLAERYAESKNKPTAEILNEWDRLGITNEIYDSYYLYHTERLENAFNDIDRLLSSHK